MTIKHTGTETLLTYPNRTGPAGIVFSRENEQCSILKTPPAESVHKHLDNVEAAYVSRFWHLLLCSDSPYKPGTPFGLAAFRGSMTLLDARHLLANMGAKHNEKAGRFHVRYLQSLPGSVLKREIIASMPPSVFEAKPHLSKAGLTRFNAFSLNELFSCTDSNGFQLLIESLERIALQGEPNARFALAVLVSMRAMGWILLSGRLAKKTSEAIKYGTTHGRTWDNPFLFMEAKWNVLIDLLTPEKRSARDGRQNDSRVRVTVLCSNLNDIRDLSWPFVQAALDKSKTSGLTADFTASLRNHWRDICRSNAALIGKVPDTTVADNSKEHFTDTSSDWPSDLPTTESLGVEIFASPCDPNYKVELNTGTTKPILYAIPKRLDVHAVFRRVEDNYIAEFWQALVERSPHDPTLPYAVAGGSLKRFLISPECLVRELTGLEDLNTKEAAQYLRRYAYADVCDSIQRLRPNEIPEALNLLSANGRMRFQAFSLREFLCKATSFPELVNDLFRIALSSGHFTCKGFAQHALLSLRAQGWISLPIIFCEHVGAVARSAHKHDREWGLNPFLHFTGRLGDLAVQLAGAIPDSEDRAYSTLRQKLKFLILCTNLRGAEDLSMPLAERVLSSGEREQLSSSSDHVPILRSACRNICILNGPRALSAPLPILANRERLEARAPHDARLNAWLDILADQLNKIRGGNLEQAFTAYTNWLKWLASLAIVPSPFKITRSQISGSSGQSWVEYIDQQECTARHKNSCLAKMRDVFDRIIHEQEALGSHHVNPIRYEQDKFAVPRYERNLGTPRSRIPSLVMDEMKNLIIRKSAGNSFSWARELEQISYIFHEGIDGARVMCPILPAIIYLLLTYPLRAHQARWLDSGEMDHRIFDFVTGFFIDNPTGIAGRQLGVLQGDDLFAAAPFSQLEFQVAVNKTLLEYRHKSSYSIPFVDPAIVWMIEQVRSYQELYGTPPCLVKESDEPVHERERNQVRNYLYPDICPLFRYRGQASFYPPSHHQITYFWGRFCGVFDRKNASWIDPVTGITQHRPGVPLMSRIYKRRSRNLGSKKINEWCVALYDIHSLRVAGVSRLLDANIPLAMVAAIAGHGVLAMTIHYYKADKEVLRQTMDKAFATLDTDALLEAVTKNLESLRDDQWALGTHEGLTKLAQARKSGLFSITISGICPGTSCKTGLLDELRDGASREVPGSRCALCRYHIYGYPFSAGLVYEYNCLLYALLGKANKQAEIRQAIIEAEDSGRHGEMWRLRGEDDHLDQEAALDLNELAQLSRKIDECKAQHQSAGSANDLQLWNNHESRVEFAIERVSHFQQVKSIIESSMIFGVTRQDVPRIAELELRDMLLSFLRRNGVDCFLAGLDRAETKRSTLQFARLLESLVPEDDRRQDLLDGALSLQDIPDLKNRILDHIRIETPHSLPVRNSVAGVSSSGLTGRTDSRSYRTIGG